MHGVTDIMCLPLPLPVPVPLPLPLPLQIPILDVVYLYHNPYFKYGAYRHPHASSMGHWGLDLRARAHQRSAWQEYRLPVRRGTHIFLCGYV